MKIVTILIAAALICAPFPVKAGVCTKEIAAVSKLLSGDYSGAAAAAMPSTSTAGALSAVTGGGAAMSAPSAAAVEQASGAVEQAKTADAAGDESSCMEYIQQAKQLLGLIQ
jgi:hypothetical protein